MDYQLIGPVNKRISEIGQILMNRGIPLIDIKHYLNTTDDDIYPPSMIANIKEGAKLLISHINKGSCVMLQIDSDCDGFTSFAVFMNYLNCLFPSFVQNNIVYAPHQGKHHGIVLDDVADNVNLVIALDASSNEYEIHKILKERGIDVLVIDHHQADHVSENACVINNQLCDYPTKSLSGAGMVYKFCCYLDELLGTSYANDYIDLAALGCCGDMMDYRDFETKQIITKGFQNVRSPFIKEMMTRNAYSIGDHLNYMNVAFYIVPYINAIARVGTYEECLLLAESMLEYRAYEQIPSTKRGCQGQFETRVEQAIRTSANVRNRQNKARDVSVDFVDRMVQEKHLLNNKILLIQAPKAEELNTNLTGLIGNQTTAKYQHPALILNERDHEGEIWWEGSARGLDNCEIKDFRQFLLDTGLVEYAEGHDNAFGTGIKDSKIKEFIEYTNKQLANVDFSSKYAVDFIYSLDTLNPDSIIAIGEWADLWGQKVKEPYVAITDVQITPDDITIMKGSTMKLHTKVVDFVKFKAQEDEIATLQSQGQTTLTIIGRCNVNTWGGRNTPQIFIEDYEIVKSVKYYY